MGFSQVGRNELNASNGTGFAIAPGILVTAAHITHVANDPSKPLHASFEAVRSPEIGQKLEAATLIASDSVRDIALLRLTRPRSTRHVRLVSDILPSGTPCGSLGFPLSSVAFRANGRILNLVERFQGANISAYRSTSHASGRTLAFFETDSLMYAGSSGCPGFLENARVFGMHVASIMEPALEQSQAVNVPHASGNRLAISLWIPAADIREFANANGVQLR